MTGGAPASVLLDTHGPPGDADTPLVSVVAPLFDYEAHIEACLASVAAQTHPRLEVIVVDDRSRDGSADRACAWLRERAERFERARLVRHDRNLGLSRARNTGFALAQADYVFVLDADNAIVPRAIARLLEALAPTAFGAAYAQLVYFGERAGVGEADVWSPEQLRKGNYIDAMALVRRSAWARVGGYRPLEFGWEDYDFWCRFVEAGIQALFVPELLCLYRVHAASMLRTDTAGRFDDVVRTLMALHPWLDMRIGADPP